MILFVFLEYELCCRFFNLLEFGEKKQRTNGQDIITVIKKDTNQDVSSSNGKIPTDPHDIE